PGRGSASGPGPPGHPSRGVRPGRLGRGRVAVGDPGEIRVLPGRTLYGDGRGRPVRGRAGPGTTARFPDHKGDGDARRGRRRGPAGRDGPTPEIRRDVLRASAGGSGRYAALRVSRLTSGRQQKRSAQSTVPTPRDTNTLVRGADTSPPMY